MTAQVPDFEQVTQLMTSSLSGTGSDLIYGLFFMVEKLSPSEFSHHGTMPQERSIQGSHFAQVCVSVLCGVCVCVC